MTEEEKKYAESAKQSGVELDELKTEEPETPSKKDEPAPKPDQKPEEKPKEDEEDDDDDDEPAPPVEKKRSIYTDYKDKKKEAKTEKERADIAEKERDEMKIKLDALTNADTPTEKKEALDEFEEFAKKIDADPKAIKEMRDLFLKNVQIPPDLKKDLEDLKAWKESKAADEKANAVETEKKRFDSEFTETLPAIKDFFPKVSESDLKAIKTELDKLSHSAGWNDKPLDYIVFKHQKQFAALVSPKKRGMEGSGSVDETTGMPEDFNPNADLTKMSAAARAEWEKTYRELTKPNEGLSSSANGKKILI